MGLCFFKTIGVNHHILWLVSVGLHTVNVKTCLSFFVGI